MCVCVHLWVIHSTIQKCHQTKYLVSDLFWSEIFTIFPTGDYYYILFLVLVINKNFPIKKRSLVSSML